MTTKKTTAKDKVEKIADIVEDKVIDTVKSTKEVAKDTVKKAKKAVTKKEIKTTLFVEYCGKQVADKTIFAAVKKEWTNSGHKVSDIKTIDLYVKPEDDVIYYVINKTETGKVAF